MIEYHPCRNRPSMLFIRMDVGTSELVTYLLDTITVTGS
jgi:hypothetical protein